MNHAKDRRSDTVKLGNKLPDLAGTGHIDASGGLIKEQNLWIVNNAGGNCEFAFHASVTRELPIHCFPSTG